MNEPCLHGCVCADRHTFDEKNAARGQVRPHGGIRDRTGWPMQGRYHFKESLTAEKKYAILKAGDAGPHRNEVHRLIGVKKSL